MSFCEIIAFSLGAFSIRNFNLRNLKGNGNAPSDSLSPVNRNLTHNDGQHQGVFPNAALSVSEVVSLACTRSCYGFICFVKFSWLCSEWKSAEYAPL